MVLYLKILLGVATNVLAQLCIKKSSIYNFLSIPWIVIMGIAILCYGLSFLVYSFILREAPLNIISPLMSISGMLLIVVSSSILFIEPISFRQVVGLMFGIISIILLVK